MAAKGFALILNGSASSSSNSFRVTFFLPRFPLPRDGLLLGTLAVPAPASRLRCDARAQLSRPRETRRARLHYRAVFHRMTRGAWPPVPPSPWLRPNPGLPAPRRKPFILRPGEEPRRRSRRSSRTTSCGKSCPKAQQSTRPSLLPCSCATSSVVCSSGTVCPTIARVRKI